MRLMKLILLLFGTAQVAFCQYDLLTISRPTIADCKRKCVITIITKQSAPADAMNSTSWKVSVVDPKTKQSFSFEIQPRVASKPVVTELSFDWTDIGSKDPRSLNWKVAYVGQSGVSVVTRDSDQSPGLNPAKDRADADLYAAGTFLAGQGTKPLYVADLKANVVRPWGKTNTDFGISAEMLTNTGTETPVNRTQVDPDSIKGALTVQGLFTRWDRLFWDVRPVAGEFTRKYPESNITTEGALRLAIKPQGNKTHGFFWFTPKLGYEVGHNLNKPSQLFKRAVDLTNYNIIARALIGADAGYVIFGTEDDPKIQVTASYQGRIPFADEPFTTLQDVPDAQGKIQRTKVVDMRSNMRHFTKNAIVWNATKLIGFTIEHKYGSLPPLFERVRNQISVGFIFKAKLGGS